MGQILKLVRVEVVEVGVLDYSRVRDRVYSAEARGAARREILVCVPVQLETLVELGSVLDPFREGLPFPPALLSYPFLVLPLPKLVEEDGDQFFASASRICSLKISAFWACV